jgi:hypothetical protein
MAMLALRSCFMADTRLSAVEVGVGGTMSCKVWACVRGLTCAHVSSGLNGDVNPVQFSDADIQLTMNHDSDEYYHAIWPM